MAKKTAAKTKTVAKKTTVAKKKTAVRAKRGAPSPFTPAVFQFLAELGLNNEREWFQEHKARYEMDVREPARAFVRAMAPGLAKISKHITASDKKVGGALMRIHRDVRFSKDKSPYKTNVGVHFRHDAGKDVHAPGIYLHIEPGSVFLGVGMYHPERDALAALRQAIVDDPRAWKKVRDASAFDRGWRWGGDTLSRAPKGFDATHPLIDDIKRKDFIAVIDLEPELVVASGMVETLLGRIREQAGLLAWQARVLELAW